MSNSNRSGLYSLWGYYNGTTLCNQGLRFWCKECAINRGIEIKIDAYPRALLEFEPLECMFCGEFTFAKEPTRFHPDKPISKHICNKCKEE